MTWTARIERNRFRTDIGLQMRRAGLDSNFSSSSDSLSRTKARPCFPAPSATLGPWLPPSRCSTGVAILPGGTAAGDPSQDDKFLTLLGHEDIPAVDNATSLIDTAHKVCGKLDDGMPAGDLVELIRNNGFNDNPLARLYPQRRVTKTIYRFINAAVQAYCPYDQGKIASITAQAATALNEPTRRVAAYTRSTEAPSLALGIASASRRRSAAVEPAGDSGTTAACTPRSGASTATIAASTTTCSARTATGAAAGGVTPATGRATTARGRATAGRERSCRCSCAQRRRWRSGEPVAGTCAAAATRAAWPCQACALRQRRRQ